MVGAGQVTDDSEMAWCLALGILDSNWQRDFQSQKDVADLILNEDFLADRYRDWYQSDPFDMGNTIRGSIMQLDMPMRDMEESFNLVEREARGYDVKQTARRINKYSKSNGCLMRIAPMAVWLAELVKNRSDMRYESFKYLVKADVEMTHADKLA